MLSLQEISDRLEIQDILARYSHAIDRKAWDELDDIFTPDAHIDYSEAGGAVGGYAEIKAWLPGALGDRFPVYQHMIATSDIRISGDSASGRTILFNPMVYEQEDGSRSTFFVGLWYRDTLRRTAAGWRISERYEEMAYTYNGPRMSDIPALG